MCGRGSGPKWHAPSCSEAQRVLPKKEKEELPPAEEVTTTKSPHFCFLGGLCSFAFLFSNILLS
jgi:hypothetical protein